jgi:hypothetical protein
MAIPDRCTKVFIIDGEVVGSALQLLPKRNETNDEVCSIRNRTIAEEFMREFERIYSSPHPTHCIACLDLPWYIGGTARGRLALRRPVTLRRRFTNHRVSTQN